MANADIRASVKEMSISSPRGSGMVAKPLRTKWKSASAERCLRSLGATMDMGNPITRTSQRSSQGVFSHQCLRKASSSDPVITGLGGSAGIAADGFDFLGQHIRKYNGKLLIKPSAKSIKSLLRKVRAVIKGNKSASAGNLICHLNPIIRGWAMYHRHAVSAKVFQSVDHAIFQSLWRWGKRRHPNKGVRWVKARYFHPVDERHWVFSGKGARLRDNPRRSTFLQLIACPSYGIPRSTVRSTPTIPDGSSTLSNVRG